MITGPFVHLSCIIAFQLLKLKKFQQIQQSQDLMHHVLSAACALGVTATFGTPSSTLYNRHRS